MSEKKVYVLHEHSAWVEPLRNQLEALNTPYAEWFLSDGHVDLQSIPPEGVFYNRMSASSHTRGNRFGVELTEVTLAWLERHNRRIINDRRAINLEVRKSEQYLQLNAFGIPTPFTIATVGKEHLRSAAEAFNGRSFITKPNRGGKGLGVQLFHTTESFHFFLDKNDIESLDGVVLLQEYIKPKDAHIIRLEFIDGKYYYAVKVDTSGGFELCPADACQIGDAFCPATAQHKFEILPNFHIPEIPKIEAFLAHNGIKVGAVEIDC